MIHYVALFVNLATLDKARFAGVTAHRCMQRLAAVQNVKARRLEVQPSFHQLAQQGIHHRHILGRSLPDTEHRLASIAANSKGYNHLPVLERSAVDQHGTQPQLAQRPLHQFLYLLPAGLDKVVAHRRLFDAISVVKVLHHGTVVTRGKSAHHLIPHAGLQRCAALEQLVTSQPLFALVRRAQSRPPDRHLLAIHHTVTVFFTPAMRTPSFVLLMTVPCQRLHFFIHYQVHQFQPGLAQQVPHALLQQADDLGQGQHHLYVGILFGGEPAELLHGSLLFNLVLSLHSDSLLFLGRKTTLGHYGRGCESRYFLRITGHPPARTPGRSRPI